MLKPPQVAVLTVGSPQSRLDTGNGDGEDTPVTFMNLSLSCDGRVVDEATAAQFLSLIKDLLEDPIAASLFLG